VAEARLVSGQESVGETGANPGGLAHKVRRGFVFSALSSGSLRLGNLVVGIVLARLLVPEDFGVYAIALMVQSVLINLAELGLAADLVRHGDIKRRGPTIASVSILASTLLAVLMWIGAGPFTRAMDAPEAAPVIGVMALTLPLAGLTAVPYARLQRDFMQGKLFMIDASNFVVGTSVTVVLAASGHGPMSLAIGRVVGQVLSTVLQFHAAGERLRLGWKPDVAASGIRFGLPLALAGVLSWTLLNVDTLMVGATAGTLLLGYYVLAFNVSSWPSSVLGTAVRAVAFPAFAERGRAAGGRDPEGLVTASAMAWAGSLPAGATLLLLGSPVVEILYGSRWLPAAAALSGLAVFGATRVVFDVWVAYLTACGASGALLRLQVLWLVALVPAMYVGIEWGGIAGAGWAHPVVALGVMLPAYLLVLRRLDVCVPALLGGLLPAVAAVVPAFVVGWVVQDLVEGAVARLLLGGAALAVTYTLLMLPWGMRLRRELAPPEPSLSSEPLRPSKSSEPAPSEPAPSGPGPAGAVEP
jgi:lipopolysaccharide exporter